MKDTWKKLRIGDRVRFVYQQSFPNRGVIFIATRAAVLPIIGLNERGVWSTETLQWTRRSIEVVVERFQRNTFQRFCFPG
jgi:hypothetical protein